MYKNILTQIANVIFINIQHIENAGLLDGKIGVALFLYNYEHYTKNEIYSELSGELIDQIYNNLSKYENKDFFNGLAGIAYGIEYMVRNKFVETDEDDDILEEVDIVMSQMNKEDFLLELDSELPLFSKGLYFLKRESKYSLSKIAEECLDFLISNRQNISLSYINSVFYFVNNISLLDKMNKDISDKILDYLFINTSNILAKKEYNESNIYTLKRNIENIKDFHIKERWLSLPITHNNGNIDLLSKSWIHFIYTYKDYEDALTDNLHIQEFLNDKFQNLTPEDLYIYNGLAGLGIELMRISNDCNNKMKNEIE